MPGLTRGSGGGRSNVFAMNPMSVCRTGLNRRVSGRAAPLPGQAGGWSHQPASRLTWRGLPGAASRPAVRAASVPYRHPAAFRKPAIQTQAPGPVSQPSGTVQLRLPWCWGVGHKAPTQFAFEGATLVPMHCKPASPLPAVRLRSSGLGSRLDRDGTGNRVCFQHTPPGQYKLLTLATRP